MQKFPLHNAEMERNERLKLARKKSFATAAEAASYLRMPYSTLAHHEAGTRGIKDDELARYASAYRVNLGWLDHGEETLSLREHQLLEDFRTLNTESQQDQALVWFKVMTRGLLTREADNPGSRTGTSG